MLTKQAIKEFQEIYQREYGESLTFDEASSQAENLMRIYKIILNSSKQGLSDV